MKPRLKKPLRISVHLDDVTAGLLRLEPSDVRRGAPVALRLTREAKRQATLDRLITRSGVTDPRVQRLYAD